MMNSSSHSRVTHRAGFMLADAMVGLLIVGVLMVVMAVAMTRQDLASRRLADQREAIRTVQAALIALQSGQPASPEVKVEPISQAKAPAGWEWVRVTAGGSGNAQSLVGLARTTPVQQGSSR